MTKNILLIGGTRFFGRQLANSLLAAGHKLTIATRGISPDDFGERVTRITVDRRNHAAMQEAFADTPPYDLVYDQMCYSPLDARIALDVFGGKVGRYVMSSTIETYRPLLGQVLRPLREDDIVLAAEKIDFDVPWHDAALAEATYSAGKRQAEALLLQDGRLPAVMVRIAHVLAAQDDFTGRLASYVQQLEAGAVFHYAAGQGKSSFLNVVAIADFLVWAGQADFLGPVNAACDGSLSALDIHQRASRLLGKTTKTLAVAGDAAHSPFDYPHPYVMDTSRAVGLGYRFSHSDAWLDQLIQQLRTSPTPVRGNHV